MRRRLVLLLTVAALGAGCTERATVDTTIVPEPPPTTLPPPPPPEPDPTETLELLKQATVQIFAVRDGFIVHSGSGTIIDPGGLILTNAHVATPEAPGLSILYGPFEDWSGVDFLVVAIVEAEDEPPVFTYIAEVLVSEGWYDLAVISIVSDVAGNPVGPLDLPWVPLGDSDEVRAGEEITVLGFPGVGGDTLSVTRGIVSGFLADEKTGVSRGWIKTDAVFRGGSSGGLAAIDGRIVGVPTRGQDVLDHLRPINMAKPLVDDALAGQRYVRSSGIAGESGQEVFTFGGWGSAIDGRGCLIEPVTGLPSGVPAIYAGFEYSGLSPGLDLWAIWFRDDELVHGTAWEWPANAGSGTDCDWWGLADPEDGSYEILLLAGPNLRLVAAATSEVGIQPDSVQVHGTVRDVDTESPIGDAVIVFLSADTDVDAWLANPTDAEVVAEARADAAGRFTLRGRLVRGVEYGYVALAGGYNTLSGCCFLVPPDATDPHELIVRLTRR